MKNWISILICLCLVASLVPAAMAEDTVTISYYDWQLTESPAGDIIREQLARYEELHPNVKIELQAVPTADRNDKLMAMILGGEMPDIVHMNEEGLATFTPMNCLEPLNEYLEADEDLSEQLIPAMVDMTTKDGLIYAIPHFASTHVLLYNADHFRATGLDPDDPPETWAELVDYAKKLTVDTDGDGEIDQWGMGIMGAKVVSINYRYWWLLWGAGGDILNEDMTASLLDSEASEKAIEFYTNLYLKEKVVPPGVTDVDYTTVINDFTAGKTSMTVDGPWQISSIREGNPDIDLRAAVLPVMEEGYPKATTGGGGFLGVSAQSENKEIAWDIIRFLSSAENQWEYASEGNFLPCRQDVSDRVMAEGDPLMGEFTKALAYTRLTPAIPQMTGISNLLAEELQFVLIGEKTPHEAAQSLGQRATALLQE